MTALIAWPNFQSKQMEREVDNQVAAPAETRTPNLHRAKSQIKSADGGVDSGSVEKKIMSNEKTKEPT